MTIDCNVKLTDILTISAIVIGPIAALMIQRSLDKSRDETQRQKDLFRILWTTRGFPARLQYRHVEALNMVGLDFASESNVINSWKEYLDMLSTPDPTEETQRNQFYRDRDVKFLDLVFAMSQTLGYKATRLEVQRLYYSPAAHGTWADQETILREGITRLFRDQHPIPIQIVDSQPQ